MKTVTADASSENYQSSSDMKNEVIPDEVCGLDLICMKMQKRISCLQRFAKPVWALVVLSMLSFIQGAIVNGLINGTLSTVIRRFDLTASEGGLISSSYDLGVCLALIFVTYIGGQGHKPKWLGWGCVLIGCGSIILTFPHFFSSEFKINVRDDTFCDQNDTKHQSCSDKVRQLRYLFYIGQIIIGIGASPISTLGITYLDENVPQTKSSLYHAIFCSFRLIGPGFGYLLSGIFLNHSTNLQSKNRLKTDDSQFIGAWWIGFGILGITSFFTSFFVLLLPKQLPGTEKFRENREKEIHEEKVTQNIEIEEKVFIEKFKNFPKRLQMLSQNTAFVMVTLLGVTDSAVTSGLATFLPRVIESLFQLSSALTSVLTGTLIIVGGAAAQLLSGFLVSKFNVKRIIKFVIIIGFFAMLASCSLYNTCPDIEFAETNEISINQKSQSLQPCSKNCGCSFEVYEPVCGSNEISYFSPCHAGCKSGTSNLFFNCSCVFDNITTATSGLCKSKTCSNGNIYLYFAFIFIIIFLHLLTSVPQMQVTIRIVPFSQRSFAVGLKWFVVRVLGTIPGPIIYGYLLDAACRIKTESCSSASSCKLYRNKDITKNLMIFTVTLKFVGLIFACLLYFVYKPKLQSTNKELMKTSFNFLKKRKRVISLESNSNLGFVEENVS